MSSSQNGDRSISEYERALGFQPGVKHGFKSYTCMRRVQEETEMALGNVQNKAFSHCFLIIVYERKSTR